MSVGEVGRLQGGEKKGSGPSLLFFFFFPSAEPAHSKAGALMLHSTAGNQVLFPCEICGRHFKQDVLMRHSPICQKVFSKKRKPFNSLKQRLQGTEITTVKKQPQPKNQVQKKSNWRQHHEDFMNAIQSAKEVTKAMKEGPVNSTKLVPLLCSDYIQCPYCSRRFNEAAAGRHINFCKEQSTRRTFSPSTKAAKPPLVSKCICPCQKREPTLTTAVESLLQNKAQEATNANQLRAGKSRKQNKA
uniref:Zinc finger C2HC-type containing 1B n=1 Tax=Crocodylus porosus TaxID=8502 RepID=A0A7M4FQL5_CROPO